MGTPQFEPRAKSWRPHCHECLHSKKCIIATKPKWGENGGLCKEENCKKVRQVTNESNASVGGVKTHISEVLWILLV